MSLSNQGDQDVHKKIEELCLILNMDRNASEEAWKSFQRISTTYTLEGDSLHWIACALYVACRAGAVPTVGRNTFVEGNCVSLTRLLRSCKLSLIHFFSKMKKWADMANLPQEMRNKVDRLERNFNVSTVIFKKFEPIFIDVFKNPADDPPRPIKSRKHRRYPCTPSEVFSFCWTLFVNVKGHYPAISDDLVNSFHLLLCCIDLMFSNALLADRRDLLNKNYAGLPENFNGKDYRPPAEAPCIIELLCENHQGLVVEAKGIKEHWWKPYIQRMIAKKILRGRHDALSGLLDICAFEINSKAVNKEYEEYVLNVGDFDERIFLGENANEEIGTPARQSYLGEFTERMQMRNNLQQHLEETRSLAPATPLTGRKYLKDKDAAYVTPVSTATQGVSRLQALLSGCKTSPSDALLEIFKECSKNPLNPIMSRVKDMGETFCISYAQPSDDHPGSHRDFAKKRLQLGESLYFKTLENIMTTEKNRFPPKTDLYVILEHDQFHRSLLACCLEIVIFSYNSQRSFPWILQIFDIQPYNFYKVIEILIRAEEGLSRDVVKHLNHIEEQILESLAWKTESQLWDAIKSSGLPVPSCEDVSLPSQLTSSPLAHPAVRRLTGHERLLSRRDPHQSPGGPSVRERFHSPSAGGTPSNARRRLFSNAPPQSPSNNVAVAISQAAVVETAPSITTNPLMSPGRTLSITVQTVQSDNGITYILPAQITSSSPLSATIAQPLATSLISTTLASNVINNDPTGTMNSNNSENRTSNKPKRTGSLGLFFRKVYHLAGVRMRDLCDRLNIIDDDLRRKIWTCFEYSLMHYTSLICDRHLDQLIMCAIYVICKVTKEDKSFQEIMRCYRLQPQAASHVYRSVLLNSRRRRNSSSSENSRNDSGSNSPIPNDRDERERESKRNEQLSTIRSSSTLPVPHPSSQPPTPTRLAGTGTHFEFEERGDLIVFYNTVYVPMLQRFVYQFSLNGAGGTSPPLSPLPRLNANPLSPWRRVSSRHSVYISPLTNANFPPSPNRPLSYSFSRSPAKDLRAINNLVKLGDKKLGKRILQDESDVENPAKRLSPDLTLRKIQNVITERQSGGVAE